MVKKKKITKSISYRLQLIDSARHMASLFSNLVNNFAEGIHKIKCKYRNDNKKYETCGIKFKDCECCIEYTNVNNDLIECKCFCCNEYYQKNFEEILKKRFANIYKFSNHDINKFILLLQKGVYPYELCIIGKNLMKKNNQ